MATIGQDCEIIIDGNGYFVAPGAYHMAQPRIRKATVRADGSEAYRDHGAGKREWHLTILARNDLKKYDGTSTGVTGQQYRDTLHNSYLNSTGITIVFTDPQGINSNVHFDDYKEDIHDLHTQIIPVSTGGSLALAYEIEIVLVEA